MAAEATPRSSRFFRILSPGFNKKLVLPRAFVKHIEKEKCVTRAKLASPNGKAWRVGVYKDEGSLYFGGKKWLEFLHAHDLRLGYFLAFSHKGNMVFGFKAFDLTACEIGYPSLNDEDHTSEQRPDNGKQFEATMTKCNLSSQQLYIPVHFVRECKLFARWRHELRLEDQKGRSWPACVYYRKKPANCGSGARLGDGWLQFARGNKLKRGDRCIFKLVSNEREGGHMVMQVQILGKETA